MSLQLRKKKSIVLLRLRRDSKLQGGVLRKAAHCDLKVRDMKPWLLQSNFRKAAYCDLKVRRKNVAEELCTRRKRKIHMEQSSLAITERSFPTVTRRLTDNHV